MPRGIAKDHDQKRAALRKGAAEYFARHGFDRASMTSAAKHCGVSKALIYHYYESKEALLFDILNAHLGQLVSVVDSAVPGGLPDLVTAILEAYADADAEHKLQLEALQALPDEQKVPLINAQRHLVNQMAAALQKERPDLHGDELRAATMTVFGILNWFYMWHRPRRGLSRSEYAALASRFIKGGLAGL